MLQATLNTGIVLDAQITELTDALNTITDTPYQPEAVKNVIQTVFDIDETTFNAIVSAINTQVTTLRDAKQSDFDALQDPAS